MIWTFPNFLTVLRLVAAPLVALVFVILPRPLADWCAFILFAFASVTDYLDGYLARRWGQVSRFGAMLDPIADKAMVVISLAAILALFAVDRGIWALVVVPVIAILFREIFVSGLREFLGADAGRLSVTRLAKWKTTVQMLAIGLLFIWGLFEHYLGMRSLGMDSALVSDILEGEIPDSQGLRWLYLGWVWSSQLGLGLLWLAAILTLVTGWDYFRKSQPFLQEDR